MPHIIVDKPEPVILDELRPGDNFEYKDWIYKVATGILGIIPHSCYDILKGHVPVVTECSGEVFLFNNELKVLPLTVVDHTFRYDTTRQFETDREDK